MGVREVKDTLRTWLIESTSRAHRGSERLKRQTQTVIGLYLGPLQICYGCVD